MKTYIAQRRIDHNNQVFEENELIDLSDSAAKPLLAVGAVIEKLEPVKPLPDDSGEEGGDNGDGQDAAPSADGPAQETVSEPAAPQESAGDVPAKTAKKTKKAE